MQDPVFLADIGPLLVTDVNWDPQAAASVVFSRLIQRLPGEAWKGEAS
jgi:hypothetical protein